MNYLCCVLGIDGLHGDEHPVHLVSTEQGRNRQLLVWQSLQSHVLPICALGL